MSPGSATSTAPGDEDMIVLDFDWTDNGSGSGFKGYMQPTSGYGNHWWATVVDGAAQTIQYFPEGQFTPIGGTYDSTLTSHSVSMKQLGDWADALNVDVSIDQTYFTSDKGASVQFDFPASVDEVEAIGDSGQFATWAIIGLSRWKTVRPTGNGLPKTEACMDLTMSSAGAVHTVSLSMNGYLIAQGTINGNGSVTLTAQNNSGVSGTVVLTYSADIALNAATFNVRWASSYTVVCGALSTTVKDTGIGDTLTAKLGPLAAGNQSWSITANSDTGVVGTALTGNVTVPGRPVAPSGLVYVSGDSTATVIRWTESTTASSFSRVYDSELNGPTDTIDAAIDNIAGVGGVKTQTLATLGAGVTGERRIIVESVLGSVESGARKILKINYIAGVVVLPRPNAPTWSIKSVTGGTNANISFQYNATGQAGVATKIDLYLVPAGSAAPADGATVDTEIALPSAVKNISVGTITATTYNGGTPLTTGWYQACVRAKTAAGTRSATIALGPPFFVSSVVLPQVATPTVTVIP